MAGVVFASYLAEGSLEVTWPGIEAVQAAWRDVFPGRRSWPALQMKDGQATLVRALIYARVSTKDGEQTPSNQLYLLREYAAQRGWQVVKEYIDTASATNLRERRGWRDLLAHVRRGGADLVLVTKLDRAFRSAKHTYDTLAHLDTHKIGFVAATQPIDTTSSTGKLLLGVLAAVAEFERNLIVERTLEGLARARAQGKRLGRPPGARDRQKRSRSGYMLRYTKYRTPQP
jgi:DNA invertase Pin-like site-specific DNA recombinase